MAKPNLDLSVYDCLEAGIDTKLISQAVSNDDAFILDMHDNSTPLSSVPVEYKEFRTALNTHREMLNIQTNPDFRPNSDIAASKNYWNLVWRFIGDTARFEDTAHIFLRVFITGKSKSKILKLLTDANHSGRSGSATVDVNSRWSPWRDELTAFKSAYRPVVEEVVKQFGKANAEAVAVKSPNVRKHTDILIDFLDPDGTGLRGDALVEHYNDRQGYTNLTKKWKTMRKYSQDVFRGIDIGSGLEHGQSFITAADKRYKPKYAQE